LETWIVFSSFIYALESTEGVKESVYRKQEEYKAELKAVSEELVWLHTFQVPK